MSTFITKFQSKKNCLKIAVKDLFDVAGTVSTLGSKYVADRAKPAKEDAACLQYIRDAEDKGTVAIVGKTNLHELAFGATGENPWYGTPINPLDPTLIPGGSSSGSAVAVASGEADFSLGTDTAGSVRVPAACCGISALILTQNKLNKTGIWPLAPSMDTVGIFARGIDKLEVGLSLLDLTSIQEKKIKKTVVIGVDKRNSNKRICSKIDWLVRRSGLDFRSTSLSMWDDVTKAGRILVDNEAWHLHKDGLAKCLDHFCNDVKLRFTTGKNYKQSQVVWAKSIQQSWKNSLLRMFTTFDMFLIPTLSDFPPKLSEADRIFSIRNTLPINVAGLPAVVFPIPAEPNPISVQLFGPPGSELLLLKTAQEFCQSV